MSYLYSASTGGFYVAGIHGDIPSDATEISDSDHSALMTGQSEGWRIVGGADGRPVLAAPSPRPFTEMQADAERLIDIAAGDARAAFAAPGTFQDEEYRQAAEQAEACRAGSSGPFPALAADILAGTFDPRLSRAVQTEEEAADLILFTRGYWLSALNEVRTIRLTAKAAVRAAATAEEIDAILAGLTWPTP